MFDNSKLTLVYKVGGKTFTTTSSDKNLSVIERKSGTGYELAITAKIPVSFRKVSLYIPYTFANNTKFFANGFQSWTDTKEYARDDKMKDIGTLSKYVPFMRFMGRSGDYEFASYKNRKGFLHSVSYAYVRNGDRYQLIGSLNENSGYTLIYADMQNNYIRLEKDLEGKTIDGDFTVFRLMSVIGGYDDIFDAYFTKMGAKLRTEEKLKGYTSWYNYYSKINEELILRDLNALTAATDNINTFQIDDGYQTAVGDWLSIDAQKFPSGMKPIAEAIHKKGLKAGIWLAPLSAQCNSKLAKEHPEWLIRNPRGGKRLINLNWGGYYGLDIHNPDVRAYLKNVFDTVLNDWGFDLVKLDFLFSSSTIPMRGKTRAELMYDSIALLRECVGDKLILGCGVPLIPCVNMVEYMRIGADMSLSWFPSVLQKMSHREDVSTCNALHNGLNRRHLNNRVFHNDPDVFLLRDYNIQFTWEQQKLIAKLIKLTGGVLFTSDDTGRYDEQRRAYLDYMLSDIDMKITDVVYEGGIYTVNYIENGEARVLKFDNNNGTIL